MKRLLLLVALVAAFVSAYFVISKETEGDFSGRFEKLKWKFEADAWIYSSPAILERETAYFDAKGGIFFAIRVFDLCSIMMLGIRGVLDERIAVQFRKEEKSRIL